MNVKKKAYLASPYGFTDSGREFMKHILPILERYFDVLNPWDLLDKTKKEVEKITSINELNKQKELLSNLSMKIAKNNEKMIRESDILIAVLDGVDVDSGVAAEIGYAYAINKLIIGYRSDFRLTGDNLGVIVNLQVEYFIRNSGGIIVRNIKELIDYLNNTKTIKLLNSGYT